MQLIFCGNSQTPRDLNPQRTAPARPEDGRKKKGAVGKSAAAPTSVISTVVASDPVPVVEQHPGVATVVATESRKGKDKEIEESRKRKGKGAEGVPKAAKKPKNTPAFVAVEGRTNVRRTSSRPASQIPEDLGDTDVTSGAIDAAITEAADVVWDPAREWQEHLESVIPDEEKDTGVIWETGIAAGYPDSAGIYLPGLDASMKSQEFNSSAHPQYTQGIFRATATSYQKNLLEQHPVVAIDSAIGSLHDAGVVLSALKEAYVREGREIVLADNNKELVKKAVLERNKLQKIAAEKARLVQTTERALKVCQADRALQIKVGKGLRDEVLASQDKVKTLEGVIEVQEAELSDRSRVCRERYDEIVSLKAQLAEKETLEAKLAAEKETLGAKLVAEKAKTTAAATEAVEQFLGSNAFTQAAPYACVTAMKMTLIDEMRKLGKHYPFTPAQLGFSLTASDVVPIKKLAGFKWDRDGDKLLKPDGSEFKEKLVLTDGFGKGIVHSWKKKYPWPQHVDFPDPPSDDEEYDPESLRRAGFPGDLVLEGEPQIEVPPAEAAVMNPPRDNAPTS